MNKKALTETDIRTKFIGQAMRPHEEHRIMATVDALETQVAASRTTVNLLSALVAELTAM